MRISNLKFLLAVSCSAAALAVGAAAQATPTPESSITLTSGGSNSITLTSQKGGENFSVDATLTTDMSVWGVSAFLQADHPGLSILADATDQSSLSVQNYTGATTTPVDFTSAVGTVLGVPTPTDMLLFPGRTSKSDITPDLGWEDASAFSNALPAGGPSKLFTLTMVASSTPGTYSLGLIQTAITDVAGREEDQTVGQIGVTPLDVTVVGTPEPPALPLLAAAGLAGLVLLKRRRASA